MWGRITVLAVLVVAGTALQGHASGREEKLLKRFGFTGVWSPDCNKPPGPGNSRRSIWIDKQGAVRFKEDLGDEYEPNLYLVLGGKRLGPNRIELQTRLNRQRVLNLTIVKEGARIRTVANVGADGRAVVREGRVLRSGHPTPWLNRCE